MVSDYEIVSGVIERAQGEPRSDIRPFGDDVPSVDQSTVIWSGNMHLKSTMHREDRWWQRQQRVDERTSRDVERSDSSGTMDDRLLLFCLSLQIRSPVAREASPMADWIGFNPKFSIL